MTTVLGIGGYSHDAAACLLRDGEIIAAAMEERFTRRKHQGGIPHRAVEYCLTTAGIDLDAIDAVGCYMNPWLRLRKRLRYRLHVLPLSLRYAGAYFAYELLHNLAYVRGSRALVGRHARLHFLEHHLAHAASAFFSSPFERALIVSIDYIGEFATTVACTAEGTTLRKVWEQSYPHSLGVLYSAFTDYLGFTRASDEYKVMGLAGYGDPSVYRGLFAELVRTGDEIGYRIDLSRFQYHYLPGSRLGYLAPSLLQQLGPQRHPEGPLEQRHYDIAAALQEALERCVLHMVAELRRRYPQYDNLCLAGGVALNCVMNGRVLAEGPFSRLYVQPAAGDDGIAIGAAQHLYHIQLGQPRRNAPLRDVRLGPAYNDTDIETALRDAGLTYRRCADIAAVAAEHIAHGRIVGWFQDRMEFGPRALGARSILADPTRADMQDILNHRVKHREDFRPFAPAVCQEAYSNYFAPPRDSLDVSDADPLRFMLLVTTVLPGARARLPAITHVDGTARVQIVDSTVSPLFYRLLREFERRRGVPVVINTSFNVRGEPIVCSPTDAIRCFRSTGIDVLCIGPFEAFR